MITPAADTAWSVLLPTGTVWLTADGPMPAHGVRPRAATIAATAAPWTVLRNRRAGRPSRSRVYIAVPSRRRPLIVASWDPGVLRYLADSVLTVPPGTGPALGLLLTAGLRLLRHPGTWILAASLGAGGVVVVGAAR
jgi:hypothetical protein